MLAFVYVFLELVNLIELIYFYCLHQYERIIPDNGTDNFQVFIDFCLYIFFVFVLIFDKINRNNNRKVIFEIPFLRVLVFLFVILHTLYFLYGLFFAEI